MVDDFVYLGVKFYYKDSFAKAVSTLSDQALKAYRNHLLLFDKPDLDI